MLTDTRRKKEPSFPRRRESRITADTQVFLDPCLRRGDVRFDCYNNINGNSGISKYNVSHPHCLSAKSFKISFKALIVCSALLFATFGCKSTPTQTALDVETLLSEGNCAEISSRLTGKSLTSNEHGALAVCAIVSTHDVDHKQNAIGYLSTENSTETTQYTVDFLRLAALPPVSTQPFQIAVIEVAFGIGGYGPHHTAQAIAPGTPQAIELVVGILEFTYNSYLESASPNTADVTEIWQGCRHLLADNFSCDDEYLAWRLHTSLAAVALRIWDPLHKTDLAIALMTATISVVEQNQTISVAARCDLGAPYEQLKAALSKDTALLGPFERAVSAATGCTRGKYAPQK